MFKREDFLRYFEQISRLEREMMENIDDLLRLVESGEYRSVLEVIKADEVRHLAMAVDIEKRFVSGE
ncbi:MAG: hypothetical protein JXD23_10365 [Spirochaetales bacterium]|nr:hypothetical protein [Spirochaetales bacterium]